MWARLGLSSDGDAVALKVELLSSYFLLPKHTPLASYLSKGKGRNVAVRPGNVGV